jgi:hypothetical protein
MCGGRQSISALGFCVQALIVKEHPVLDGGIRISAAGPGTRPLCPVRHLSDAEKQALRLAVNRLGEKGQWNLEELKLEFEELILTGAPIEMIAFLPEEIDQIVLGDDGDVIEQGPLAPAADAVLVAKLGDMFRLGAHRVHCRSATERRHLGGSCAATSRLASS